MSRIVSYVTGAAEEGRFGGLAGGYGGRQDSLHFDNFESDDPAFEFRRTDTDESIRVTHHVADLPSAGPTTQALQKLIDGTATPEERDAFSEAWHGRIKRVLSDDDLFTVDQSVPS